ncbi:hypothetical protein GGI04_004096 [Coemansia thaxteri]|nr:hypothetical protein GGI04_004096 [Coemansia thaxteri]
MAVVADSAAAPAGMADTVADAGCNGFGARLSGSFYTPMQEYFEVTNDKAAAGSAGDDTAGDLAKGADSQSAVSPDGSPGLLHSGADIEKAERPAAVGEETRSSPVGGDPDSDDVPLSMKVREEQDPAGGLGIVHGQPARLRLSGAAFGAGGEGAPVVLSSSRLRFSPDAVVARGLGGRGDEGDSIDLDMDMDMDLDMDLEGDAATLALADESSQQACAMGKYLYDVEEFRCLAAGAGVGGLEPPVPRILQGIAVPGLEEHAEWLGKREVFNGLALQFYIGNYDFGGQRIDESLRRLCSHIFLRGESQVIDRLLVALARRYVACNPDTTLRTVDVAHAVTYSTLLLNTDLHIADIRAGDRMTKSRFVRNTIDTVAQFQGGGEHLLAELELAKRSMESAEAHSSGGGALRSLVGSMASLHAPPYGSAVARTSRDVARLMGARGKRFSFFEPSSAGAAAAAAAGPASRAGSEPPHQHPQPPAPTHAAGGTSSASSLRAFDRLRRKVSTSGARSVDGGVELAGGGADLPELAAVLKDVYAGIKARPLGQPQYARLAMRTTRPSSVRSMPQQTGGADGGRLGVARRAGSAVLNGGAAGLNGSAAVLNGSALAPLPRKAGGSPVESAHIRSGVLVRKHLFERTARKAAHRAWRTCYVSVDRGTVAMYKMDARHGAAPDGRELTDTSLQLGSVSLRHTMTHMLPSPGYSRSRPHVFALQLPSGGVYLFQTASEVELRDWVAACNYWAARESKAPYMIGGVFNMEYGWDNTGDFALRFDEREARADRGDAPTLAEQAAEARRVLDERDASKGAAILEWTPPNNTMQRSDLDEAAQLKALLLHIAYLEEELVAHKKVQGSIEERFYPKTTQFHRAFSNWERKAQYILQELIKYQSYADVLQGALKQMHADFRPIPEEDQQHALLLPPPSPAVMGSPDEAIAASSPSSSAHASSSAAANALSASRASLPQPPLSARRTLDLPPLHGQLHPPSKALPIKELLAPASEKARNRASVIVPVSVSSSNTATSAAAAAAEGCHPRPIISF